MAENYKKLAYFLPNIFTALNMVCGFVAIMLSLEGDFYKACIFLTLGAVFDSVDGRIARLTGTQSSFGEQFDSMSDLISFGLAPALLFYLRFLVGFGRLGMACAFVFVLFGAMRLARFNANLDRIPSDYFQGMPIPMSALSLVGFILLSLEYPWLYEQKIFAAIYILFYALLMISNIPFPSFKNSEWVKKHKNQALLLIFAIMFSVFIYEKIMIALLLTVYVVGAFIYNICHRDKLKGIFKSENGPS